MSNWLPYSPTKHSAWDLRRVAHLHRRVVFGATWNELQRDLDSSPQDAIGRVLAGKARTNTPADFEDLANLIGNAAIQQPNADRLKAWWIYRVLYSPDPLRERLTLMWHNHFATSNLKVDSLSQMKLQNETLRRHAVTPFGELLHAMMRDPAMLIWLDAPSNRRGRPNENLGRELMELFTLGIGNYSESDVKNTARALTGLDVKNGKFVFDTERHDHGTKSILGQSRDFNAEQVADLLLEHPATAECLAKRLVAEFFSDGVVSQTAQKELSSQLRDSNLDIGMAVETILRSQLFFSDANINTRLIDPLSFLIAPLRGLEMCETPPSTLALTDWLRRMGQDLFYPPNVAGWPGGRSWLTTGTVIARVNYVAAVIAGEIHRPAKPLDLAPIMTERSEALQCPMSLLLLGRTQPPESTSAVSPGSNRSPDEDLAFRILSHANAHLH